VRDEHPGATAEAFRHHGHKWGAGGSRIRDGRALHGGVMGRQSKEYRAFTLLIDKLLTVPKATIQERMVEHREKSARNPRKRGPKPRTKP
jgi:hypothetical protein